MFPTYSWLSQHHVRLHAAQNCVMRKKEPVMAFSSHLHRMDLLQRVYRVLTLDRVLDMGDMT